MTADPAKSLQIYFDGACPLCRREAGVYQRRAPDRATFIDIAAPGFDAAAHGLDARAINREIHARTPDGRLVTGVDALAEMWRLLPHTRWLAAMTTMPGVRQVMQAGYVVFARLRPYLPGRRPCGDACAVKPS